MAVYSINDIEKLSGIKAHTIRIWEKRYGIIEPKRTETNIRYYLDEDLQRILNISILYKNGYKISKIAKMSDSEMINLASQLTQVSFDDSDSLDSLMFAMLELDDYKFNLILDHHIDSKGFEKTMNEIVYPLMEKLSTMWITGSIKGVHENFVANIIRRKTITAIESIVVSSNTAKEKVILYLSENETHELSLLFMHYLLKSYNYSVLNLGMGVPLIDVIEGQNICGAKYIFSIFNDSFTDQPLQPYIDELTRHLPDCKFILSGYQSVVQNLQLNENVQVTPSVKELKNLLETEIN